MSSGVSIALLKVEVAVAAIVVVSRRDHLTVNSASLYLPPVISFSMESH
jgi:hypothetical protein